MAEARTRELRRVTEAQQALAAAAARPDPVPAVLARLAASLGGSVALWPGGRAAGPELPAPAWEALSALLARVGREGGPATATDRAGGHHLAAYALAGRAALGTATPARAPGDHTVASVAAVLLTLLTAERPAGAEAAALTRLLLDGNPAAALTAGPWYAVHARGSGAPQALAAALGTVLLDPHEGGVRLLTDREPAAQPGWRLGVSAPAAPSALATADAQAARALQRAEAARTPLARHTDPGFAGLVGEAEARAHAEALLGPLSPPCGRPCAAGWPTTATGTARPRPWASTATPSASASAAPPSCWTGTWTTRTCGWSCGSRCASPAGEGGDPAQPG